MLPIERGDQFTGIHLIRCEHLCFDIPELVRHTGEDFIDEEGITVASVLTLQAAGIYGAELSKFIPLSWQYRIFVEPQARAD